MYCRLVLVNQLYIREIIWCGADRVSQLSMIPFTAIWFVAFLGPQNISPLLIIQKLGQASFMSQIFWYSSTPSGFFALLANLHFPLILYIFNSLKYALLIFLHPQRGMAVGMLTTAALFASSTTLRVSITRFIMGFSDTTPSYALSGKPFADSLKSYPRQAAAKL